MKIVNGDLIKLAKSGKFDTVFHVCNCFHMMESVISRQLSHEFPEAYEADLATAYGAIDKLGAMSSAKTSNGTLIVIHSGSVGRTKSTSLKKLHLC